MESWKNYLTAVIDENGAEYIKRIEARSEEEAGEMARGYFYNFMPAWLKIQAVRVREA